MNYEHDYFIIESLNKDDIKDGKIFFNSLKSINKYDPIYIEVKNQAEFEKAIIKVSKSEYKNLFISSHGDEENIILLNGNFNAYDLLDLDIDLSKKRIFMSTCKGGSFLLAKYFIKKNAYSVIGSPDILPQITAVGMWTTMIIIFERLHKENIDYKKLNKSLLLLSKIYEINLSYFSFVRNKKLMKEYLYDGSNSKKGINYEI